MANDRTIQPWTRYCYFDTPQNSQYVEYKPLFEEKNSNDYNFFESFIFRYAILFSVTVNSKCDNVSGHRI